MRLTLLAVPYDSALRDFRMGLGPERLLGTGLEAQLRAAGYEVQVETVEANPNIPPAEIRTAFELNRLLAARVRTISEEGGLPVILAGNCGSAVGTLAGLSTHAPGVVWFDSHGDFNTPETTIGGFLDGMALAIVAGQCWTQLAATVPGFQAVPEQKIILLGTRDLDPLEQERLADSQIMMLAPAQVRAELDAALLQLSARTRDVYVHIDLDVLDPQDGRANALAVPDGLRVEEVGTALERIGRLFHVRAVALTAYDPAYDPAGRVCRHAVSLLQQLLRAASAQPSAA